MPRTRDTRAALETFRQVARTLVDCFKYRNKLGLDVAIEALRFARARKRIGNREVLHFARLLRQLSINRRRGYSWFLLCFRLTTLKVTMSINPPYARVGHLVRRLQQISVAIFLEEVGVVGITPVQFAALTAINEHPRLDIQRLANLVAVDRATLGTVINRLVKSRLVEGCEDPFDRRSRVVRALSAGQKLLESAAPHVKRADLRLLKPLTDTEREVFMIYLRQIVHAGNDFSRVPLVTDANVDRNLSLYSRPGYLVRRLQQVCEGIFTDEVAELGLTPAQYAALAVIAHFEGEDNTRLANAIALDKVTTGSIVQRLDSRGLIKVRSNAKDKRSKKLEITPDGAKMLRVIQPRTARADERVLSALTAPDSRQFMRLLDKVVEFNNDVSRAPLKGAVRKTSGRTSSQPA